MNGLYEMTKFRVIAFPLSWLAFLWSRDVESFGILPAFSSYKAFSVGFWISLTLELLLIGFVMTGMLWGTFTEYKINKVLRRNRMEARKQLAVLGLLASSAIPSLVIWLIVADKLGFALRKAIHLGISIVMMPVFLGEIWFRLKAFERNFERREMHAEPAEVADPHSV